MYMSNASTTLDHPEWTGRYPMWIACVAAVRPAVTRMPREGKKMDDLAVLRSAPSNET